MSIESSSPGDPELAIAIIGMAGRFPGADSVADFWENLKQARDVLTHFDGAPRPAPGGQRFVNAGYVLRDVAGFDAEFFDMTPREAAMTDPQHRLFLECAWEALEQAGYIDETHGTIGVYASANFNTYLFHVCRDSHDEEITRHLQIVIGNDKDYLPTRVSYKLGLTGPSIGVHTACSSSLVGVSLAAQALLNHQCDLALAGGAGVRAKQAVGYFTDPDQGLLSHDGRCRPFDANATGYVGGNGVGVVVLKRLADALAARDTVYAVIRGFAVNNDGAGKVGYTAPSVTGQANVIGEALALSGVDPGSVAYVETHGTGTPLGDPIEAEALGRYYGRAAGARCVLGSVKSNIGHLDAAAGAASLIKATLCLKHGYLPATRHFEQPNPQARLDELGFAVQPRGQPWPRPADAPRRAAVSSLGIGGTNAHIVLEEAPPVPRPAPQAPAPELLVISARTKPALAAACSRLAEHLSRTPELRLADVAFTLQLGRKTFEHRWFVVAHDLADAARVLATADSAPIVAADPRAAELVRIGQAWLAGEPVDFAPRWAGRTNVGRVPLPTYPFERQRHWIDAPPATPTPPREGIEERRPIESWFYAPSWKRSPPLAAGREPPRRWLVFAGQSHLGAALMDALARRADDLVIVSPGPGFAPVGPGRFEIDPSSRADFDRLLDHLCQSGPPPARVLHLWSLRAECTQPATFAQQQHLGFFCLLQLAQALDAHGAAAAIRLFVVSDELFTVLGDEPITADKATLLGACRVLPQELPALRCRVVDVTGAGAGLIDRLLRELDADSEDTRVAYRGIHRFTASQEPMHLPCPRPPSPLRTGGVYLVIGGFGGVSMALAEHLARTVRARLVLTSRSELPPRCEWDRWTAEHDGSDRTSRRIAAVQRLEQLGAEVLVLVADVADEAQMAAAITESHRRFGTLHGVLHAAGPAGRAIFRDALDTTPAHADAHFRPKVAGLRVLAKVLPQELDFVLICSSLSTVLGGLGLSAYAAANHFMDAFTIERSRQGSTPWIAVNWDIWRAPADPPTSLAIRTEEGGEVLEVALALQPGVSIIVSTVDLTTRWERIRSLFDRTPEKGVSESAPTAREATSSPARPIAGRPALAAAYEGPRNDLERCVVEIWQDTFGIEPIGIHDGFRDLGGESLAAMPLVARLSETFHVKLRMARFFSAATIARLAEAITEADPVPGRAAAIAVAIQTAQRMSPDAENELPARVTQLLAQKGWTLKDDPGPRLKADPERRHEPFPLTEVQEAYFLGRSGHFELGNIACHGYEELAVVGLDLSRYEDAWNRMIARHDMLRAIVKPDGTQVILAEVPRFRIEVADLRRLTPEAREQALQELRAGMSHRVADPHRWPILAVRVSLLDDLRACIHFSMDALIIDGTSGILLDGELRRFYEDPSYAPAPLSLSFRDYVLYLRAERDTEAWRASERHWKERASALPPAPELPLRVRSSEIKRPHFTRRQHRLERAAWARLKQRGRELGATSSVLILAAFAEVLRRFGPRRDFTVNLTLFDRQPLHPDADRIIGDFTSTLLVEVRDAGGTFVERLRALQESFLRDLDHRRVSGMHALRHYAHAHRQVGAALMPVVFTSMLGAGGAGRESPLRGHLGELIYAVTQTPQVLLDHQLHEEDGALILAWDAVEDAFLSGVLDTMFAAYTELLACLSQEDSAAWQEARPVGLPAEQVAARRRFNATDGPASRELLHAGFCRMAAQHPEREAVIAAGLRLTYGELAERAAWLAARLLTHGVAPGEPVAIVMERGWEQIVAVFAVLTAGGAYVPIDAALPEVRVRSLLESTRARAVLTQTWVEERLRLRTQTAVHTVDDGGRSLPAVGPPRQRPEDIAYVIYTSGSTGVPKGVVIEHRSAVNTIEDINARFAVGAQDRVLGISSLSFDLSVYDIFGTLAAGGSLVLPDRGREKDPEHWLLIAQRERVTIWNSVPALLQMLVNYAAERGALAHLRLALLSGDWIPLDLPERLRQIAPSVHAVSLGGATEAAIWSILHPITSPASGWTSVPYGLPMRNQRWFVLDEHLEECPDGVTGELYIGGMGLARGYWEDADKTAERFILWPAAGERLYRTGDLGRMRDGFIELLGRKDHQVKIGGHRVELGEIEAALMQHAAAQEAVVVAQGDARDSRKQLVAYVVQRADSEASESELKQHLRERLAEHMIPRRIRTLAALPLSANGKVDRRALPMVELSESAGGEYVAPRNELERRIAEVVAEGLKLPRVSVNSRFLDLGATSLVLIEIHRALEARLGRDIPVLDLFQRGSVADLAAGLGEPLAKNDLLSEARQQGQRRRQQRDHGRARATSVSQEDGEAS